MIHGWRVVRCGCTWVWLEAGVQTWYWDGVIFVRCEPTSTRMKRPLPLPPTVPTGMGAPQLMYVTGGVSGNILVLWGSPQTPNGIISQYTVERSTGGGSFSVVKTVVVPAFPSYLDVQVVPFTNYCYRIDAANSAGATTGPSQCLLTPEAGVQGVLGRGRCREGVLMRVRV